MERLDILIYSPTSCIAVSSPRSTDDTELCGQPLNAIMNVPDGEFAICMQSLTFEGKVGYVRQALRIEEGMPNASHQWVTAATPGTQNTFIPLCTKPAVTKLHRVNHHKL